MQKTRTMGRRSLHDLGKPFWIMWAIVWHSSSVATMVTILSHVIASDLRSLPYINMKASLTVVLIIWVGLSHGVPARYWEVQSDAKLHFPGQCFIWNLYTSILSLKFNRQGFLIFSMAWSENIFTSGKGSTVTSKSRHLSINIQYDPSPYTRAKASPSTGAYRDSE